MVQGHAASRGHQASGRGGVGAPGIAERLAVQLLNSNRFTPVLWLYLRKEISGMV